MGKRASEGPTLHEVLTSLGWRHEKGNERAQGRVVFDATGARLGQWTADETWLQLHARGLHRSKYAARELAAIAAESAQ